MSESPLAVIREVYALGGRLLLEGDRLVMQAPEPLPESVRTLVRQHKPELMAALGAPVESVLRSMLCDLRTRLPPSLATLSDESLLRLLTMTLLYCWKDAIQRTGEQ